MVNKDSFLFKSVLALKESYTCLNDESDILNVSVRNLEQSVDFLAVERRNTTDFIRKMEEDLKEMKKDG